MGASLADLGLDPGQHAIRTTCVTPASTTTPVAEIALDLTLSNVSLSSRASGLQVSYVAGQTTGRLSIPVTVQICSARFDVGQSCDTEARPATSLTD